ncbi:MAG: holo-[acyl-carrier-protein] synthase [Chloroflexi bacterium HGW-Chloroflexi-8]|nr:MAG: holo-[acyl-carrier-protein] synthase [Chloroflexi bacterium HGW-Chloroflexi-8]
MMIRNGVDLVEISRFENLNPKIFARFIERVYTDAEKEICENRYICLAGRFAAKEAVSKALGTGIGIIRWKDVEILRGNLGEPILILHNKALEIAEEYHLTNWSISISHGKEIAIAFVIASSP